MLKLEFQLEKYINFDLIIICSRYNKNGKAFSIMGCAKNDRSYKLIRFDNIIIVSIATKTKSKFAWQQQFFLDCEAVHSCTQPKKCKIDAAPWCKTTEKYCFSCPISRWVAYML